VAYHSVDLLTELPGLSRIGATHLLHLAWCAEPGKFWDQPENCDWVAASLRLVRSFAAAGGRRLVVAGSCAEYAWDRPVFIEERLGPPPTTLYGQAKRSLFEILVSAAPILGLSLGWGRVFMPYGPREDSRRLLGTLIAARADGRVADFSAGEQVRDFLHVEDVAGALVQLLESDVQGAVNIGSGQGIKVREFISRAAALAAYSDRIRLGARPIRQGDPASLVADIARLRDEVGFCQKYSLDEGLTQALGLS
jgi:nucleoside-diphosphate-sugar epimerase